jgi:hypothetical protein
VTEKAVMRASVLLLFTFLGACASPLTEARGRFEQARYPDAAEAYAALGKEVRDLSEEELFEYSLYRGLTHLALGDSAPAERWLTLAKRLADSELGLASQSDRNRLLSARRAMGHAPGD